MAKQTIKIESILGGIQPSLYFSAKDQYLDAVAVDPDLPVGDSDISAIKTSGVLIPTAYEDFTGANLTATPLWLLTNPKDTKIYTYLNNGRIISYTNAFASETLVGTAGTSSGNGFAYYNNYLYYASNTDIGRYGPLDGTPALDDDAWTSAVLGSQTALTDTTYPSLNGIEMPNHPMHVHVDNQLYVGDVVDGQGVIHAIKTTKTTNEGDTNDNSQFNVLDLPFGFIPTDIESYGTDLVISAIQTTNSTITQGKAVLFFWDTTSDSFYRQVTLPDPYVTALLNNNGILYLWTGNNSDGVQLLAYLGGDTVKQIAFLEEGAPPYAGAVDAWGDRIVWGCDKTTPSTNASVYALGSKVSALSRGIHNIAKSKSGGANPAVYSVKYLEHASNKAPRLVIGWRDDSNQGIDKIDTNNSETLASVWRSSIFRVGRRFTVKRIRFPLGKAVAANMTLTPKIWIDDASASTTLTAINNTNYSASERYINQYPNDVVGRNNFFLELNWTGTVPLPVSLPIEIEIEITEK